MGILPMTAGVRDGRAASGLAAHVSAFGVIPGRLVVGLGGRVEARVESIIRQLEAVSDDEGGVRVVHEIIFGAVSFGLGLAWTRAAAGIGHKIDLLIRTLLEITDLVVRVLPIQPGLAPGDLGELVLQRGVLFRRVGFGGLLGESSAFKSPSAYCMPATKCSIIGLMA